MPGERQKLQDHWTCDGCRLVCGVHAIDGFWLCAGCFEMRLNRISAEAYSSVEFIPE